MFQLVLDMIDLCVIMLQKHLFQRIRSILFDFQNEMSILFSLFHRHRDEFRNGTTKFVIEYELLLNGTRKFKLLY